MSGGGTLAGLQCAAIAVLLSFAARRTAPLCAALFLLCACMASLVAIRDSWTMPVLAINAAGIIACAVPIHLKRGVPNALAILLCVCTGIFAGLALAVGAGGSSRAVLILILLFFAGQRLVAAGYGIAPKVVSGWLIAIAMLGVALPMVSMPGYVPDHMD